MSKHKAVSPALRRLLLRLLRPRVVEAYRTTPLQEWMRAQVSKANDDGR